MGVIPSWTPMVLAAVSCVLWFLKFQYLGRDLFDVLSALVRLFLCAVYTWIFLFNPPLIDRTDLVRSAIVSILVIEVISILFQLWWRRRTR